MNDSAQLISSLLASLAAADSYATHFALNADPQLNVEGIGRITLPVSTQAAHHLCAVAKPAMHGYKEQTRLDPKVRDTWEIPANALSFDSPKWQAALDKALVRICQEIKLPPGCQLTAELHNLLVYGPGQFFAPHQDSEKADGMLGSLVITLPSHFTGGEFVISHQGQTLHSRGSESTLGAVAFYADCQHEVRPVKQGHRVVLTYNLVSKGQPQAIEIPGPVLAELGAALGEFWNPPAHTRNTGRLVYLLDHQYTQRGLSWNHLKGADAIRCAALRQAARDWDVEIHLTLADVQETWSTDESDSGYNHWAYDDDEGDEDYEDPDEAPEYEIQELLDSSIELHHWVAVEGGDPMTETDLVESEELCYTRSSQQCTPYHSEYEGYMGNYGNTVDRWYHRAALVIWPRRCSFIIRARLSLHWAMMQIAERLAAGDRQQAMRWSKDLSPLLENKPADASGLLDLTLPVAVALSDAETATMLLAPFELEQLTAAMAPGLAQLAQQHGLAWIRERQAEWTGTWRSEETQLHWLEETLPTLVPAMRLGTKETGDVLSLCRLILEERWQWLKHCLAKAHPQAAGALLALMECMGDAELDDSKQQVIEVLLSTAAPLALALQVLQLAAARTTDTRYLAQVYRHCTEVLEQRLQQPERSADDWSIPTPELGRGDLMDILGPFLTSATRRRLEWKLATDSRRVIHNTLDRHHLPVKHVTLRVGRPYTLVLEKTEALFEREAVARQQWAADLLWLQQHADLFTA